MEESVFAVAHRDVYRREDDADRVPGILGIFVDGTAELVAISEMDRGDGSVCSSQGEGVVGGVRHS